MPLRDELIVCLSDSAWTSGTSGRQQVMSRLARDNDVLYIDPPEHIDGLFRRDSAPRWQARLECVAPRLQVVHFPLWLGHCYKPWLEGWLARQRARLLQRLVRRASGDRAPLLYTWHPDVWPIVRHFRREFICYHVYDDYVHFDGVDAGQLRERDLSLARRANVVIGVSEPLARDRAGVGGPTFVVHNGANYELFAQKGLNEPNDLAKVPRPRACCVSRLHSLVDYDSLAHLARHSEFHLVVVGPLRQMGPEDTARARQVLSLPKVHWVGEKRPDQVPAYVAHSDVCLIPYRGEHPVVLAAATPQKLMEYLSAGKPVIAGDMPLMRKFSPLVRFACTPDEWVQQLRAALAEDSPEWRARRQAVGADNSWDAQVGRIREILTRTKAQREGAA